MKRSIYTLPLLGSLVAGAALFAGCGGSNDTQTPVVHQSGPLDLRGS